MPSGHLIGSRRTRLTSKVQSSNHYEKFIPDYLFALIKHPAEERMNILQTDFGHYNTPDLVLKQLVSVFESLGNIVQYPHKITLDGKITYKFSRPWTDLSRREVRSWAQKYKPENLLKRFREEHPITKRREAFKAQDREKRQRKDKLANQLFTNSANGFVPNSHLGKRKPKHDEGSESESESESKSKRQAFVTPEHNLKNSVSHPGAQYSLPTPQPKLPPSLPSDPYYSAEQFDPVPPPGVSLEDHMLYHLQAFLNDDGSNPHAFHSVGVRVISRKLGAQKEYRSAVLARRSGF